MTPLLQGVAQEGSEERGVGVLSQLEQVADVELEVIGELQQQLMHAVQELKENRTPLVSVRRTEKIVKLIKLLFYLLRPLK